MTRMNFISFDERKLKRNRCEWLTQLISGTSKQLFRETLIYLKFEVKYQMKIWSQISKSE